MAIAEQKVKEHRAEHSELALKFLRDRCLRRGYEKGAMDSEVIGKCDG